MPPSCTLHSITERLPLDISYTASITLLYNFYSVSRSSYQSLHPNMFGKLFHLGFDAVLIAAFLAGIKRSTGLTCVAYTLTSMQRSLAFQAKAIAGPEQGRSSYAVFALSC